MASACGVLKIDGCGQRVLSISKTEHGVLACYSQVYSNASVSESFACECGWTALYLGAIKRWKLWAEAMQGGPVFPVHEIHLALLPPTSG